MYNSVSWACIIQIKSKVIGKIKRFSIYKEECVWYEHGNFRTLKFLSKVLLLKPKFNGNY